MTTYTQFSPNNTLMPPFQFQVTLDGTSYTVTATWNIYRESWYINVYTLDGDAVFTGPMVSSPDDYDITLTPGLFTDALVYRGSTNSFETP